MPTFEELLGQTLDRQNSVRQQTVGNAVADPAAAQKALKINNGFPAAVNELDPNRAAQEELEKRNNAIAEVNRDIANFVVTQPTAARATYDDYENLDAFSKAFNPIKTGWNRGIISERLGAAGAKLATGLGSEEEATELERRLKNEPEYHGFAGGVQTVAQAVGTMFYDLMAGLPMAGAGAMVGPVGAAAGAVVGMGATGGINSAGRQYLELKKARDANGNPLPESTILAASALTGIAIGALNMVGIRGGAQNIAGGVISEAIRKATANPGVAKVLTEAGKDVAATGIIGSGMMGTATAMEQTIADVAKMYDEGEWKTIANDPKRRQEVVDQIQQSLITGFGIGAGLHATITAPSVGRSLIADTARVRAAERDLANYDATLDAADAVKSKEGLQALIDSMGANEQVLAVPFDQIAPLFQRDPKRFARFEDLPTQLLQSADTGGDVHLRIKDLLAEPELAKELREDVRIRPDSLTAREAKELTDNPPDYSVTAYHGSPHIFDAFSLEHIGRGEGAQVYGHGLYFAEREGIAKSYRENLAAAQSEKWMIGDREFNPDTRPDDAARQIYDSVADKAEALEELNLLLDEATTAEDAKFYREAIKWLKAADETKFEPISQKPPTEGALYQVKLKVKPEETILYDRPVKEHSEEVLKKLAAAIEPQPHNRDFLLKKLKENETELGTYLNMVGGGEHGFAFKSPAQMSAALSKAGIKAIKYLDASSRGQIKMIEGKPLDLSNPQHVAAEYIHDVGIEKAREEIQDQIKSAKNSLRMFEEDLRNIETNAPGYDTLDIVKGWIERYTEILKSHQEIAKLLESPEKLPKIELSTPDPTHNYVILDDTRIEITHRNGEPVLKQKVVEAVERERKAAWLDPLFRPDETIALEQLGIEGEAKKGKAPLKMTEAEYARYSKLLEQLQAAIERKAEAVAEREISKRLKPEWERNYKEIENETRNDLSYRPDILADTYLRTGDLPNQSGLPKVKLDQAVVETILGSKDELPRGVTSANGVHPDVVAPTFGYRSGEHMLRELAELKRTREFLGLGPKEHFNRLVKDEATARMERKYGKLDEVVAREAQETVVERAQTEVLAAELEFLSREGDTPITRADLESRVAETFATLPIAKARDYDGFMRTVAKAGRAAELALLKGDIAEAFLQKQRQYAALLNAENAKAFKKSYDKFVKTMGQFREKVIPSVSQEFTNRVHEIMLALQIPNKRNQAELLNSVKTPLSEWAEGLKAKGYEVPVVDFTDPIFYKDGIPVKENFLPFNQMPAQAFHWINDTITTIIHNGREDRKLVLAEGKMELEAAINEGKVLLAKRPKILQPLDPKGFAWARWIGRSFDATLLMPEQLMQDLSNRDPNGIFVRVIRGLEKAKYGYNKMLHEFGDLARKVPGDAKFKRGLNRDMDNRELRDWQTGQLLDLQGHHLLGIMYHMGNESNFAKLTSKFEWMGEEKGWDRADVEAFVERNATKEHWDVVQHMWNIAEEYFWPKVEEMHRRVTGIAPDKIEGRAFRKFDTDYRGGYAPLIADIRWPDKTEGGKGVFNEFRGVSALPPKGYTKARTEAQYPVSYDFSIIISAMQETLHDLAYREALISAKKFFDQTPIKEGIIDKYGLEYYNKIDPWLEGMATGRTISHPNLDIWNRVLRGTRTALVATEMVGRFQTIFAHGGAVGFNSIGEISNLYGPVKGPAMFVAEMARLWGNPLNWPQALEAQRRSGELTTRMHDRDRDLRAISDRIILGQGNWRDFAMYYFGAPFMMLDQMSAIPTYTLAEQHYLKKRYSPEEASLMADTVVRNAHGSQGMVDLAPILRGDELTKTMTVAYGTFNHVYNRLRLIGQDLAEGTKQLTQFELAEGFGKYMSAFNRSLWYLVLVGMAEHYIKHSGPDEDKEESAAAWVAKGIGNQAGASVPLARDLYLTVSAAAQGKDIQAGGGPHASFIKAMTDVGKEGMRAWEDKELSNQWWLHFAKGAGYAGRIPGAGQIGHTGQFLIDMQTGRQHAEDWSSYIRGLTMGKSHPHERLR